MSAAAAPSRLLRRALVVLFLAAALGLAFWILTRPEPIPVALARVERGRVEATVANTRAGSVSACRRARLAPPAGGQIEKLPVREGERVEAGALLLELWNDDLEAQLRQTEQLARAAPLGAEAACLRAALSERDAGRARELRSAELLAEEGSDRAGSEARAMRAACEAARIEVRRSQEAVAAARAALERTILRAPFAGIVAEVTGELGEFTTPSPPGIPTPPAVDLIDDSCFYVTAPMDEVDAPAVRVGMPARIVLDAFAGRRFAGRVRRVAPYVFELERQARTVDIEVEFADASETGTLLVGYSADVEVLLEVKEDALRVPTQALLEGNRVLVYLPGKGTLEERTLEVGLSSFEFVEVRSGLAAGDEVVVSLEREGLGPGVKVAPELPAPAGTRAGP